MNVSIKKFKPEDFAHDAAVFTKKYGPDAIMLTKDKQTVICKSIFGKIYYRPVKND